MIRRYLFPILLAAVLSPTWAQAGPNHGPTALNKSASEPDDDRDRPKPAPWDVEAKHGPTQTITIDTSTGTWLSLDVSPDGKTLVFDLLGDIYSLPIDGGDATSLTKGPAWDMQPRFSPDGKEIAFTSDRGGGDNIWVMNRDGKGPTAITKETYRLFNSPTWTPDGKYIAARKHFTSRRSVGAGEIWLMHRHGGSGVQMTKRKNQQKDLGEPTFSPDGRYLYYSRDATPGDRFEYNKDSNKQIYAIERMDRRRGTIEHFLGGPGGAIRPTPSPDGKWMAYVRRIRTQSVLVLHDMRSGAERILYDQLDRDLQETWAIHGVYPSMAWTPDSKSVVFWAGGHIHRTHIKTGKTQNIPFRVATTRKITRALRNPVSVAPEEFDTRMLRWVTVAPNGRSVVFQALGHLYIRKLPNGRPQRLTRDKNVFEFYPSFSRDSRSIVYTTWNDEKLGTVRIVSAGGGRSRALPTNPGHYIEPTFSPDGKSVIYRKISGGYLVSKLWSRSPGLYQIPVRGGRPTKLHIYGGQPHFGADQDLLFYKSSKGGNQLKSLNLKTGQKRVWAKSKAATSFQVSPNGQSLAFQERYKTFVVPFPATGRMIEVGPRMQGLPVARLSSGSGDYVHWSGDSKRLYWSLGPDLFQYDLANTQKEKPPKPESVRIGFSVPTDTPRGVIALVGGRVVTMRGDEVIERGTVLIKKNRIQAVGSSETITIPPNAHVVDVTGKTVLPGIIDVHDHSAHTHHGLTPQKNWSHYALLGFGVTTVHDPSHRSSSIFSTSELARAGRITAPRIFSTGTILYGASGEIRAEVNNLNDARDHLQRMAAYGAISVKSYNQPRRDQRQQVLKAAREKGLMVLPEGGALFQHNMNMIVDGHTGIEHAIPLSRAYDDVIQLWAQSDTGYTPTLNVAYGGLAGEVYWYQNTEVSDHPRLRKFVPRSILDPKSRRRMLVPDGDWNHIEVARFAKRLIDRGGRVQIGAHGQREGLGVHWEIWTLVDGGFTPFEALRAATLHGAWYLGLDRDLGSIEPGKLADLFVVNGNPLTDIRKSELVQFTMVNGRLYEASTMAQIGNEKRPAPEFYWQQDGVLP